MAKKRAQARQRSNEAILQYLTEKSDDDSQISSRSLFYFLGCFEAGIPEQALASTCTSSQLYEVTQVLRDVGVIDSGHV